MLRLDFPHTEAYVLNLRSAQEERAHEMGASITAQHRLLGEGIRSQHRLLGEGTAARLPGAAVRSHHRLLGSAIRSDDRLPAGMEATL